MTKLVKRYSKNIDEYTKKLNELESFKNDKMNHIVTLFKTISLKPLRIGNYWFYYVEHNGVEVPSYCHQNDYKGESTKFLPIYDKNQTFDFGWADFKECCRIFDLIEDKIMAL
jgi:hypothetical protein